MLIERQEWYCLTLSWSEKGVHTFPKSISPKVNVVVWMEFELVTVYYATGIPSKQELLS